MEANCAANDEQGTETSKVSVGTDQSRPTDLNSRDLQVGE
jgi:hypothetical protein